MNAAPAMQGPIFVVDDERANLKLVAKVLSAQGYADLHLFADPREMLDRYADFRPDLILLDLNMPHLDGFDVLARLKALDDPLAPPVVMLTAQTEREFLVRALEAGARDFVSKPFDFAELTMRVRNLLDAHRGHRLLHDRKAALEEQVRARTRELRQTRLLIARKLGMAAEYRDSETGDHIRRMSKLCALIAARAGWDDHRCELILHASPLHDIGKIGVPDSILLKPGSLTPEEREIMKRHTVEGARLLEGDDSELMRMARDIALHHHERWDGAGYPDGLAGREIPEAARIAAIADVFDALISARPYKPAWTFEAALGVVRDGRGSHFDPDLAGAFLAARDEVERIVRRRPEAP